MLVDLNWLTWLKWINGLASWFRSISRPLPWHASRTIFKQLDSNIDFILPPEAALGGKLNNLGFTKLPTTMIHDTMTCWDCVLNSCYDNGKGDIENMDCDIWLWQWGQIALTLRLGSVGQPWQSSANWAQRQYPKCSDSNQSTKAKWHYVKWFEMMVPDINKNSSHHDQSEKSQWSVFPFFLFSKISCHHNVTICRPSPRDSDVRLRTKHAPSRSQTPKWPLCLVASFLPLPQDWCGARAIPSWAQSPLGYCAASSKTMTFKD